MVPNHARCHLRYAWICTVVRGLPAGGRCGTACRLAREKIWMPAVPGCHRQPGLVRVTGFEPAASWSRTMRAAGCATPGYAPDQICLTRRSDLGNGYVRICRSRFPTGVSIFSWFSLRGDRGRSRSPAIAGLAHAVFAAWWVFGDSNPGPSGYEPDALTS